jgi:putative FmdB family regulatory protein
MPIYEYRCEQGHIFEVIQRIADDPVAVCQTCEAPVERVYHPVAVHFKGSGFYNTDYGTRKRQRENGDGTSEGGSSADSGAEKKGAGGKSEPGKAEAKKPDSSAKTDAKAAA